MRGRHIAEPVPAGEVVRWALHEFDEVSSTQTVAKDLAAKGAPEGTAVVAKSQTSGEGRLGRSWASPVGGLYMSFVLRPPGLSRPETVTLVAAVAVAEGIERATGLSANIRWPNDVMLNGRKIAGVIAEAQTTNQEIAEIVIGVGVNCNTPVSGKLAEGGTSLVEETGRATNISELMHHVLGSFSQLYERWRKGEDLLSSWTERVATIGKVVLVKLKEADAPLTITARGLDEEGGLVLESGEETRVVRVEDVEWLRERA